MQSYQEFKKQAQIVWDWDDNNGWVRNEEMSPSQGQPSPITIYDYTGNSDPDGPGPWGELPTFVDDGTGAAAAGLVGGGDWETNEEPEPEIPTTPVEKVVDRSGPVPAIAATNVPGKDVNKMLQAAQNPITASGTTRGRNLRNSPYVTLPGYKPGNVTPIGTNQPKAPSTPTVKQNAPMQTTDFKQPTQGSMVKTQSYSDFTKQAFGPGVPFWQPPSMESQMTNWDKGYKASPQFGQYSDRMAQDLSGSWDTMFQNDMDSIFNDPKLNGFDLSDADLQRYDLAGYQNYKDRWPEYRKQLIERNNSLRSQHEFNLRNWSQLIQSFTKQKGRAPNAQEKAQLATLFDKKFGQNKAKQAVDYASMRVTRNKMRDTTSAGDLQKGKYYVTGGPNNPYPQSGQGNTTTQTEQKTDPQQDPRWYDTVYQLMQEHPGMSSGVAALIAASLIYGSGSGKKRDRGTDLLLALLGGGAAYWGMNKWLSPAQTTADTTPAQPQADASQST